MHRLISRHSISVAVIALGWAQVQPTSADIWAGLSDIRHQALRLSFVYFSSAH